MVAAARSKVLDHFGEINSSPDIFACSSNACYQRLGGTTSRAKAFGGSKILLSPRGITAPLIAHEWSHAELYDRLGGYPELKKVPAWFNEGLAVVVSDEPTHSEQVWNDIVKSGIPTPTLAELTTQKNWPAVVKIYSADTNVNPEALKVVYATAGHEVRGWLSKAKSDGLIRLITLLKQDVPFEKAYQSVIESQ